VGQIPGDTDIAAVAAVLADPGRARMLLALGDGRALAATTLAAEAGVAASTASAHLAKLVNAGLLQVERHGRHRYYRLTGPHVGELLEALARLAPAVPVRSLREGTRAHAVRSARTCYDHLAGQLGTAIMGALIDQGALAGGDGTFDCDGSERDRLSSPGWDCDYQLTDAGRAWMDDFGVKIATGSRRPLIRYCVDWSEQRHHLSGALGAALLTRLTDMGWLRRAPASRAVHVTSDGHAGLSTTFGIKAP
jgi:DNA-binding transcriptional ArsR family regulator